MLTGKSESILNFEFWILNFKSAVQGRFNNLRAQIFNYKRDNFLSNSKFKIQNSKSQKGFTLLELMIVLFIIVILVTIALTQYQATVQHAREVVLKDNLYQMRKMIDQYTADKGKRPQSVDDLVSAGYLREKPIDPITDKAEWQEIMGDDPNSTDGEQGLVDVKSTAEGESSEGKSFSEF